MTRQELVREQAHRNYEENLRFEEMTDIAERLGYPIDTTIHYEMIDGAAYCTSDTVARPFHNQTLLALQRGESLFTGDQAFEVERLRLEHQEALLVDSFGRGEIEGDIIVKFSKVPDAVVEGRTSIKGYRRDLLRSFVRLYYKTDGDSVACRLFTLDGNSRAGMNAISGPVGIDVTRASEAVLAERGIVSAHGMNVDDFVDEFVGYIRGAYDTARYAETGERSYAGSVFTDKHNAMNEVTNQTRLVAQHMAAIAEIVQLGRGEDALELERQKAAAAIRLASQGISVESIGGADVAAEVQSGTYGRECATAQAGMNQAQELHAVENVWRRGECQVCFAKTMVGSCAVCAVCAAADDRGEDLLRLREQNMRRRAQKQAVAKRALLTAYDRQPSQRHRMQPQQKQHNKAQARTTIVIGGTRVEYYDKVKGAFVPAT